MEKTDPKDEPTASADEAAAGDEESIERVSAVEVEPVEETHLPPPPPRVRKAGASSLKLSGTPRLAGDLMTRQIITIGKDDVITDLEEKMETLRFRHLPVVDGRKLVGLITHGDLLHASSSFLSPKARERDEVIHKLPAHRIMQSELITVNPDSPLAEVAVLMWEARIGCVLVTEEGDEGHLVGIITEGDFLRLAHHLLGQAEATPE